MTKLCAEAMGYEACPGHDSAGLLAFFQNDVTKSYNEWFFFSPLEDDAQAMGLVKKFGLCILKTVRGWYVSTEPDGMLKVDCVADLNRAIVECVAKMQSATK